MPLRLPKHKVAASPLFDPDMTESGLLYIPDQAKQRVDHGVVKYIGPEVKDIFFGDIILFSGYTGTLVAINKELLIIIPDDFITAVLMPDSIEIPGLWHFDEDGEPFPATYESAISLIAQAFQESSWNRKLDVNSETPKKGEVTWK